MLCCFKEYFFQIINDSIQTNNRKLADEHQKFIVEHWGIRIGIWKDQTLNIFISIYNISCVALLNIV